ncbi:MAG: hypothetical protein ACW98X_19735 [Promethearchaeota archaeon]
MGSTEFRWDNLIYSWIVVSAKNDLTPIVFIVQQPLGFRLTTGDYAEILFLEQWANGTVIPSGIDLGDGLKGFELGLPTESNISYNSASALFDTDNSSSFIDNYGILEWIDAYNGDVTVKNNLIALFNLDSTQMDMTLNWLFTIFKENIVPLVLTPLTGYTMTRLAGLEFHRQWTNGTLFVNGLDLDPAFGLISITDWELGIPMQSNINHETSQRLWDEEESYSLLSYKGNGLWFMASIDIDAFNAIKDDFNRPSKNFKLDDTQIKAIIAWFAKIKEDYSLPHLKEKLNLPLDVYTYANTVGLGFIIGGAIFLALGCVSIVYIFLSKRR